MNWKPEQDAPQPSPGEEPAPFDQRDFGFTLEAVLEAAHELGISTDFSRPALLSDDSALKSGQTLAPDEPDAKSSP